MRSPHSTNDYNGLILPSVPSLSNDAEWRQGARESVIVMFEESFPDAEGWRMTKKPKALFRSPHLGPGSGCCTDLRSLMLVHIISGNTSRVKSLVLTILKKENFRLIGKNNMKRYCPLQEVELF